MIAAKKPAKKGPKLPKKSRKKDFTTADVVSLCKKLQKVARDAEAMAKSLSEEDFKGILKIDGGSKAKEAITWLRKWVSKVSDAREDYESAE